MCSWCGCGRGPFKVRIFPQGFLKPFILKLLMEKPMHGYGLIEIINKRLKNTWNPGSGAIYSALNWLAKHEYVEVIEKKDSKTGKIRKYYKITESGNSAIEEYQQRKDQWLKELEWMKEYWKEF